MTNAIHDRLQALLEQTASDAPSVMLRVKAPLLGLDFCGAEGISRLADQCPVTAQHGFRIASMSKTFTGVLVAQLIEGRQFDEDSSIAGLLPRELIERIPVAAGHRVEEITVSHLLRHRGGFNDFALSEEWFTELSSDPGRARTPREIIHWALEHTTLVGAPGDNYLYSDTGYVLLGDGSFRDFLHCPLDLWVTETGALQWRKLG